VAHELPTSRIIGVDVLEQAVDLARRNAVRNDIPNAQHRRLDIFDDSAVEALGRFDCIVANPPYIPRHEYERLDASVKQHESPLALLGERPGVVASQDGLDFYRRIAEVYPLLRRRHAPAAGIPSLVVEVGHQQAQAVRKLIDGKGHGECKILKDYAGIERSVWLYDNNE
jgi:release factor glutamine methyltransferase